MNTATPPQSTALCEPKKSPSPRRLFLWLFAFTAAALATWLPLRLWQQLYYIESQSGFWLPGSTQTIGLLLALLVVVVMAPMLLALRVRRRVVLDLGHRRRWLEGLCALLVAAAMAYDAATALVFAAGSYHDFALGQYSTTGQGTSFLTYMMRSGAGSALFAMAFALASAVHFFNIAFMDFQPRRQRAINRLFALAPMFWAASSLMRRFARTINYLRVSDLFLNLITLLVIMLFCLCYAQFLSGIHTENKSPARLFVSGIPAVVLGLGVVVPRCIVYDILQRGTPSQDADRLWVCVALAVYILVFFAGRLLLTGTVAAPEPQPSTPPQEEPQNT